jgi:hypothetical protein
MEICLPSFLLSENIFTLQIINSSTDKQALFSVINLIYFGLSDTPGALITCIVMVLT